MALSGNFHEYKTGEFGLYCEWNGTQSISDNSTTITLKVYLRYYTLQVGSRSDSKVSINGKSQTYTVAAINDTSSSSWHNKLIKTYKVVVPHNSDGTKSCKLSASWRFDGTYSGVNIGTITASTTVTLNTIARASTITSASNVTLGNACSVKWTPASSSFKYKIKFKLGDWSVTRPSSGYITPSTTSAYTYTDYTFPLDVARHIPDSTTGTVTAYLYTYSGSTQIGSTSSKTFTVTVPNNSNTKPTCSISTSIVNSNSTIANWGVAVVGYSRVKIETTSATAKYDATISSYAISGGYSKTVNASSLSYTGGIITTSGNKTFTVVATDSRGINSNAVTSSSINFFPYSSPSITSFTATRGSDSNVNKITVRAQWTFSSVGGNNSSTATLYYKRSTATSWTNYGTIANNTNVTLSGTFSESYSYDFRVVVADSLNSKKEKVVSVSTTAVLLDFRAGGKGLGIGKVAETNSLEVALTSTFMRETKKQHSSQTSKTIAFNDAMFWKDLSPSSTTVIPASYGGVSTPKYRKIGDRVDIAGGVTVTWDGENSISVATLPSGYRPANYHIWMAAANSNNLIARMSIDVNGVIRIQCIKNFISDSNVTTQASVEINTSFFVISNDNSI